jgi:hypothetical protein
MLNWLNTVSRVFGLEIVRANEIRKLREATELFLHPSASRSELPEDAAAYLDLQNPRLQELRERYRRHSNPAMLHSLWSDEHVESQLDLRYFRGDNVYVWQHRKLTTAAHYLLAARHLQEIDHLDLLNKLSEDDLFGAYTFRLDDDRVVSRDLLDSVAEIHFLVDELGLEGLAGSRILDIGAGYGRLAHRLSTALPEVEAVLCVDAVAESTFLSEYYLRFRGVDDRAPVVPFDEIEDRLATERVEVAVNIHSFSECTESAVAWWLDLLGRHRVPYLMIVPNPGDHGGTKLLTREGDGRHLDFAPTVESAGYRLRTRRPKYQAPSVQAHGVFPSYYYLFELA